MHRPAAICLITPGHLASTPRLVKNADALALAGYRVHVVAGRHFAPAEPLDASILASARWTCTRVAFHAGIGGFARRLLRQLARRRLARSPSTAHLFARAQHAGTTTLAAAAARFPADFYFGHGGVAGLAAAAAAARQNGTRYGFDVEDWHEQENSFVQNDPAERIAVRTLLRTLLPDAAVLTCAAPLIGEALVRTYGVASVCVLNVFPLAESPVALAPLLAPSVERPAVLYWFSQTIGPGRGLEQMLDVLGRLRTPTVLHLRGFVSNPYRTQLLVRAHAAGARPPVFLPPALPAEMARLAAGAHLGLSLEQAQPPNRDLCLTNKIFTYLLAGVPVVLTPTRAQRLIAGDLGHAALMLDLELPTPAAALDAWFARNPASVPREAAWHLAHDRYNWDREQELVLKAFSAHLPSPPLRFR